MLKRSSLTRMRIANVLQPHAKSLTRQNLQDPKHDKDWPVKSSICICVFCMLLPPWPKIFGMFSDLEAIGMLLEASQCAPK